MKNFPNFTGKHLYQSLFFNKVAGLNLQIIKKETVTQVFSYEYCESFDKNLFTEHLRVTASILSSSPAQS